MIDEITVSKEIWRQEKHWADLYLETKFLLLHIDDMLNQLKLGQAEQKNEN
jgi:hypothetical protein